MHAVNIACTHAQKGWEVSLDGCESKIKFEMGFAFEIFGLEPSFIPKKC